MANKVNTVDGTVELPTATEYIPVDEVPKPNRSGKAMVRGLHRVMTGKGLEVAYHEPTDEDIQNHVYICDECGQSEALESDIEHHLRTEHDNDA